LYFEKKYSTLLTKLELIFTQALPTLHFRQEFLFLLGVQKSSELFFVKFNLY